MKWLQQPKRVQERKRIDQVLGRKRVGLDKAETPLSDFRSNGTENIQTPEAEAGIVQIRLPLAAGEAAVGVLGGAEEGRLTGAGVRWHMRLQLGGKMPALAGEVGGLCRIACHPFASRQRAQRSARSRRFSKARVADAFLCDFSGCSWRFCSSLTSLAVLPAALSPPRYLTAPGKVIVSPASISNSRNNSSSTCKSR